MSSKAETIAQALVTTLTVPEMSSVPAARVYRELEDAIRSELFPAIVVELAGEPDPVSVMIGTKDRMIDAEVIVLAAGATRNADADTATVEAYNRIFADRTLGGLAIEVLEGPTRRERDTVGEAMLAITKTYRIEYRTGESSLET